MKRLLDMTKRERRGTIVLLLLMGAVLLASLFFSMRKDRAPVAGTDVVAIEAFEAEADSAVMSDPPVHHKTDKKKSHKRHAAKKPKPANRPRRLDPVPQF